MRIQRSKIGRIAGMTIALCAAIGLVVSVCACSSAGAGSSEFSAQAPVFNHESGTYSSIIILKMSCDTTDATLYYTLDGSAPTTSSAHYAGLLAIVESTTVKAAAFKNGTQISSVSTATYVMSCYDRNRSGDGGTYYYKDGVKIYFSKPTDRDYLDSRGVFFLDSGSLYVYGIAYNKEYTVIGSTTYLTWDDEQPCYWIGGVYHALPIPVGCTYGEVTYSFGISNGQVYLTGKVGNKDESFPCYWKGDECVVIDTEGSVTDGILVAPNGDVIIPGTIDDKPVCWKNTTLLEMEIPAASKGSATHVCLDGSDLYVAGTIDDAPCYWKNSKLVKLTVPSSSVYGSVQNAAPNNMCVSNGNLYIGGFTQILKDDGKTYWNPTYWKNGVATILSIPGENEATGGVWGFYVCDDIVIPTGDWESPEASGSFCVLNGTVYITKRSR